MYHLKITGDKELLNKLNKLPVLCDGAYNRMITTATLMAKAEAQVKAPADKGILRKSIQSDVKKQGNHYVGRVGTNLKYAPYQEYGTGIYAKKGMITPKRSRVLAWKGAKGTIFARQVRGVKPKLYMKAGLLKVQNSWDKIIDVGRRIINTGI